MIPEFVRELLRPKLTHELTERQVPDARIELERISSKKFRTWTDFGVRITLAAGALTSTFLLGSLGQ